MGNPLVYARGPTRTFRFRLSCILPPPREHSCTKQGLQEREGGGLQPYYVSRSATKRRFDPTPVPVSLLLSFPWLLGAGRDGGEWHTSPHIHSQSTFTPMIGRITPLSIDVFALCLIDLFARLHSAQPQASPQPEIYIASSCSKRTLERTRLVEARAQMCLEFANS